MAAPQPLSIRLDPDTRTILDIEARKCGVGLATYIRNIASERARAIRKAAIRAESKRVGEYTRTHPEAQAFYDQIGAPGAQI